MLKVACPSCGAEIAFRSPALPSRVCDYCRTIVVRRGGGVEAVGQAAILPFDVSPVRIGMRGRYDDLGGFEVIGRVRWGWTDGSWNEWLALFDDGSHGWLAEAMGQYMMTRERALGDLNSRALDLLDKKELVPVGLAAELDGETLQVVDARWARCIASEGELPFTAPTDWRIYSVDLRSPSGRCASLQREEGHPTLYAGRYVTLDELAPTGLRPIEGWDLPAYGR